MTSLIVLVPSEYHTMSKAGVTSLPQVLTTLLPVASREWELESLKDRQVPGKARSFTSREAAELPWAQAEAGVSVIVHLLSSPFPCPSLLPNLSSSSWKHTNPNFRVWLLEIWPKKLSKLQLLICSEYYEFHFFSSLTSYEAPLVPPYWSLLIDIIIMFIFLYRDSVPIPEDIVSPSLRVQFWKNHQVCVYWFSYLCSELVVPDSMHMWNCHKHDFLQWMVPL